MVRSLGKLAHAYTCDCSSRDEIQRVAEKVKREVGDILVNNAGILNGRRLMNLKDDEIEKTIKINTLAHFWVGNCVLFETACVACIYLIQQVLRQTERVFNLSLPRMRGKIDKCSKIVSWKELKNTQHHREVTAQRLSGNEWSHLRSLSFAFLIGRGLCSFFALIWILINLNIGHGSLLKDISIRLLN